MPGQQVSPNLALDQLVALRRVRGESIVHLGFGESRLPVFAPLAQRLRLGASRNAYGPVVGDLAVRQAVSGYFTRRRMPTHPEQVIMAPGSKPLLMALQMVVPGDVVLPRPCWVTYGPQAEWAGKHVFGVPIPDDCGGVPAPDALRETVRAARKHGRDPKIVILNSPDNPTGTVAPPTLVREVCAVAEEEDLLVVSDEIYRDLVHDPDTPFLSPAEVVPDRTVVVTGLSKSLALGGWRIGTARFPMGAWGTRIREGVASYASEVWSTLAGPMQEVAAYAFDEPPEIRARLATDARLHGAVAGAVYEIMRGAGAACRRPNAGFYVYPDLSPVGESLRRKSITDAITLQARLLDEFGVAVLAGAHFGDDPHAPRFRAATSMLYGDTEEQQAAAQETDDPLRLPHIAAALDAIETSFTKLCS
ncbi:pyridoxal phosphate-dependent aminotransferase [Amycolatopsis taiwanensis]|uniref:pyridoxal phosphate-dependent aminotransferase n=1 Tax=Amycolatopsis taiwanensis TaxID=342230 RepID=UPI000489930E|nr:pyridoxal phosphate-dependent aminotransferase [Amycolatopsis taiwanensis]